VGCVVDDARVRCLGVLVEGDAALFLFNICTSMHALPGVQFLEGLRMMLRSCNGAVATTLVEDALPERVLAPADDARVFHFVAFRLISSRRHRQHNVVAKHSLVERSKQERVHTL
jgi:hypothetical protein